MAAKHLGVVVGLDCLLSLADFLEQNHCALGTLLCLLHEADRLNLTNGLEFFFDLLFSDIKGNVVDENVVVESLLHVLRDGGEAILVELILLLVDEAGHENHAAIYLSVVHLV